MATYYIKNGGSDSADGLSDANAWATIAKVNGLTFSAGDSILFAKGSIWREQLTVPSSGSSGNPIIFGAYGTGADPIINGSALIGNIWSYDYTEGGDEETGGVFAAGFETGDLTQFTSYSHPDAATLTIDTGTVNNGTYSCKFNPGTYEEAYLTKTYTTISSGSVYLRAYFYFPTGCFGNSISNIKPLTINSGGSERMNLAIDTNASAQMRLRSWINSPAVTIYTGTYGEVSYDAWHYIEIRYKIDGSTGGGEVWLDGTSKGSSYVSNVSATSDRLIVGQYGWLSSGVLGGAFYFDDVKCDTSPIGAFSASGSGVENVWNAAVTTEPQIVFFNGTIGTKVASKAACNGANKWYWASNVLSVYSTSDPYTAFTSPGIESGARNLGIVSNAKNYCSFTGLLIEKTNQRAAQIQNADYFTFTDCTFQKCFENGFYAWDYINYLTIDGCTAYKNGGSGIVVSAPHTYVTISDCTAYENAYNSSNTGDFQWTAGIKLFGDHVGEVSNDTHDLIEHCTVHHNGYVGTEKAHGIGIWLDSMGDNVVRYNICYDNNSHGIYFEKTENSDMYYNITYHNAHADYAGNIAIESNNYPAGKCRGNKIYNNVMYNSQYFNLRVSSDPNREFSSNEVKNNIASGTWNISNVYFENSGASNTGGADGNGNVYEYNCFGPQATNFITYAGASRHTYAAWETAYGGSTHSINADPLMTDPANVDFTLQATSPCINAGVDVGLSTDYAGNSIVPPVEIGAYNFLYAALGTGLITYSGGYVGGYFGAPTINPYVLSAAAGNFGIAGINATFRYNHVLTGTPNSFAITGPTVNLLYARIMPAATGSFDVTGTDGIVLFNHALTGATIAFSITGPTATVLASRLLTVEEPAGSFVITDSDVTTLYNPAIQAVAAAFGLTLSDATLTYTPGQFPITFTLAGDAGSYEITGIAASPFFNRLLTVTADSFAITLTNANLFRNRKINCIPGTYGINRIDAILTYSGSALNYRNKFYLEFEI